MFTGPTPSDSAQRVVSIDVLRGLAVLGILIMNIAAFSMIEAAYSNPSAYGDLTGAVKSVAVNWRVPDWIYYFQFNYVGIL